MKKELYERSALEIITFTFEDVIATTGDPYEGWNPKEPAGTGSEYEGWNPHP